VGHGNVTLGDALAQSCNVFFFHYAAELGSGPLVDWSRRFGFGHASGIELPDEAAGNVPTDDSMAVEKLARRTSQTQAFAIGQGALTVTPLQVARMMAAVANGGRLVRPTIYARPQHAAGPSSVDQPLQISLKPETLAALRQGLWRVVNDPSGTAYSTTRLPSLAIAGKTGTAENGTSADHGWFAGYAPADEPKLAVVVVLEHAESGATMAGTMARRMVEQLEGLGYLPSSPVEVATQPEFPPGKG
jgi:penicillin-binding protein 2